MQACDVFFLKDRVLRNIVGPEQIINLREVVPIGKSPEITLFLIDKMNYAISWITERDVDPIFT